MLDAMALLSHNTDALVNTVEKQRAYLHNIFYLSGYTMECIINYGILKHFKWKEASDVATTDHSFSRKCDFTYYKGTNRFYSSGEYRYCISGHNFQENIRVLNKALPCSKIPFIDPAIPVNSNVKKLFNAWRAEIRYNPSETQYLSIYATHEIVQEFVSVTDTVYNELMKIVG